MAKPPPQSASCRGSTRTAGTISVAFDPFSGRPIDACTFAPGAWGKMADWINGHIEQHNLYFSVGEPKPGRPTRSWRSPDIARIRALFADLDPEGGAEEFDSERARIRLRVEELQRGPLPPSFVIDSGGGMQVFWKLDEPIEADAASQDRVENIGRAIAHALKADAVQNIDRIMRLPGTTNFPNAKKRRKGRNVRPTVLMDASGIRTPLTTSPRNSRPPPESAPSHGRRRRTGRNTATRSTTRRSGNWMPTATCRAT